MFRRERIESPQNPLIKRLRKAARTSRLTEDGCIVAEGPRLLWEALRSGCQIETVVCEEAKFGLDSLASSGYNGRVVVVDAELFSKISTTQHSQGVLTLVRPRAWELADVFRERALAVVLDRVQDPGNAGTIMRSAEAFGASGIVFLSGSVSPYNPKTVRASAGSVFRLPLVSGIEPGEFLAEAGRRKLQVLVASADWGRTPEEVNFKLPTALVIGNEGEGVRAKLDGERVRIPTRGVESLNAAAAATVLLYEASRQRGVQNEPL